MLKQLRGEVAGLKEESQKKTTEIAALKTKLADTSLATKVAAMQSEMQVLKEDNRELRSMLDTAISNLREQVIGISTDLTTTRHQLGDMARLSSELETTKQIAKEEARQRNSLRTGIATCADGVQKLRQELTGVRASVATL